MPVKIFNGHTFFPLHISCPVCYRRGKLLPQTFWQHGQGCGGKIFIGDNAHCHCIKCGADSHVMEWKYSCPKHSTDCEEQYVGANALVIAAEVYDGVMVYGGWQLRFMNSLSKYTQGSNDTLGMQPYNDTN